MSQIQYIGNLQLQKLQASITNSALTFTITGGTWPSLSGILFVVELGAGLGDDEKVLCSGHSGGLVTVASGGRGYDGTTAVAHQPGETVSSTWDASSATDFSDHIYNTSRDDHTLYTRVDGSRSVTGLQHFTAGVNISGGGLTIASGGGTAALQAANVTGALGVTGNVTAGGALAVTGNAVLANQLTVAGPTALNGGLTVAGTIGVTSELTVPDLKVTGLSGLTTGRYVGAYAGIGSPASGSFLVGDFGTDADGAMWVCTTAGAVGGGAVFSMVTGRLAGSVTGPVSSTAVSSSLVTIETVSVPVKAGAKYEVSVAAGGQQSVAASTITYFLLTTDDAVLNNRVLQGAVPSGGGMNGGSTLPYVPGSSRTTTFTVQALTNTGTFTVGANGVSMMVKRIG